MRFIKEFRVLARRVGHTGLLLLLICGWLTACTHTQVAQEPLVIDEAAMLQAQQAQQLARDQQLFASALALMQAADASEADLRKAKAQFEQLLAKNPAYLGAALNSADIAYRLQQFDEARTSYLAVVAQADQQQMRFQAHSLNQLGLLAREQGAFEMAEQYYREALNLEPDNPVIIRNLAILLDLYRGQLSEALVLYERYQAMQDEADAQVKDWIFDLKNRLPEAPEEQSTDE